jgi:RNA-directed DNA polymerase
MAKATPSARAPKRAGGCGGVRGAARVQGVVWNTRDPSARPESGQACSYKPKAKSSRAQRESEGIVVLHGEAQAAPTKAVRHNVAGGKGPCGGHAGGAGKREGMAGQTGPNDPGGQDSKDDRPSDKVRQLQRQLWAAAKRAPARRFHALYGHLWRDDILQEAWRRGRSNRGAAGIDGVSIPSVEQYDVQRFLQELGEVLRAGEYGAQVVRRAYIPKADGRKRPLGIPTVRDRVVQMAAKLVLEPIFEADFEPCSYGFRRGRSAQMALERLRQLGARGGNHVLDADIENYFGSIEHDKLLVLLGQRVSDRRMLKLVRQWLQAGVMEAGVVSHPMAGTPQAGVISPLLSNIYLHVLDRVWTRHGAHLGTLVRYADDFVVMCASAAACEEAQGRIEHVLGRLGLRLHPQKTRRVELTGGAQGFDFLPSAQAHERKAVGAKAAEAVLPAPLAEPQGDEARACARAGADPGMALSPGCAKRDRPAQSGAARLGAVLPQRQRSQSLHCSRRLRRATVEEVEAQTRRSQPARGPSPTMGPRLLRKLWITSPARNDPLSRASLLETGVRVMLRADRPLVSRVREIRTHGLNGGVGSEPDLRVS